MATKRSRSFWGDLRTDVSECLLNSYEVLGNKLQLDKVLPRLIQEKILSIEDKQEIMAHTTSQERAQALLDKIITRGNCDKRLIVDVLRRSGQGHLADMLEGKPNSKVARTEKIEDMTEAQLQELNSRMEKVYEEEVEQRGGNTSLEGLRGCLGGDAEPRFQVGFRVYMAINAEMLRRCLNSLHSFVAQEEAGRQVGTAFAADWVGDKKFTSDYKQMYKLKLNKVRKDQTIKDAIFDQLLWDTNYNPSFSKETLWRHMEQTQEEILFVLEGLDRLNPFTSPEILQLIDKKLLPRATVVVTVADANGA